MCCRSPDPFRIPPRLHCNGMKGRSPHPKCMLLLSSRVRRIAPRYIASRVNSSSTKGRWTELHQEGHRYPVRCRKNIPPRNPHPMRMERRVALRGHRLPNHIFPKARNLSFQRMELLRAVPDDRSQPVHRSRVPGHNPIRPRRENPLHPEPHSFL